MSRRENLERLLKQDPDDLFLNFGLAMELAGMNLPQEALARFDRVLTLDPAHVPAHNQKAVTLMGLGWLDDARTALAAGVEAARLAGDSHAESKMQALLDGLRC